MTCHTWSPDTCATTTTIFDLLQSPHHFTRQSMGNCCGSESGNFKGEGRTLSAAPANAPPQSDNQRAAVPPKISAPQGHGRTLGKNPQAPEQSASAKEAAAKAAEVRTLSTKRQTRGSTRMVSTAWL